MVERSGSVGVWCISPHVPAGSGNGSEHVAKEIRAKEGAKALVTKAKSKGIGKGKGKSQSRPYDAQKGQSKGGANQQHTAYSATASVTTASGFQLLV
jgi:hypothetical protein